MKIKNLLFIPVLAGALALASCNDKAATTTSKTGTTVVTTTASTTKTPLSYAEYLAAANDEEVTIKAVIQDRCTWYKGAASFYLANEEGGFYVYNMKCTEAEYEDLIPGTEIVVTGAKAEWMGEVEISFETPTENAGFEIVGTAKGLESVKAVNDIAKATLDNYKNQKVSANVIVTKAAYTNHEDFTLTPAAGTDVYFQVKDLAGNEATYVVEAYLEDTQYNSDTYNAVCELNVGDYISLEGFVYYYDNPQLQVTNVTKPLSYAEYLAAAKDEEVTIQAVIQNRCTWYKGAASFYLANEEGGFYVYNMKCTDTEYETLVPGTEIVVTGAKAEWMGEVEISFETPTENAGFVVVSKNNTVAEAIEVEDIATATLDNYKNQLVSLTAEVVKVGYTNHEDFTLTPAVGTDVYFQVKDSKGNEATYVVEAYLETTQFGSDTYTNACNLQVGDVVSLEGFVYYYDNPQLQVTKIHVKA